MSDDAKDVKPDLLQQAKDDFACAEEYWKENREKWLEDAKFCIPGNQWPEKLRKAREAEDKPCLETDKLNQYRRQVVNDSRQNRPGIKVRPVDDTGDDDAAEAFQGIIRDICDQSNLDEALDTAIDHAAKGGFGYLRVLSQYVHERTFLQELVVRRVRNPLAVLLSPHMLADGSDTDFGFFIDDVPKKTFKERYPKAKVTDWNSDKFSSGWSSEHNVRVCEYYYKVKTETLLHQLEDGTFATDEEYQRAVTAGVPVPKIMESRPVPECKVKWCRLTGAEILEENDWLGKYIPIVPVYGNEDDIEGKVIVSGLIRSAKDAQRLHNYARTKFAERVAMTPLAPWTAAEESIQGHPEWSTANSGDHSVLTFRAYTDDGKPLPRPERVSPSDIPAGFAQDSSMSEHDIQASMGMYAASVGQPSNEKSGRAIMARQREGDTATFHYQDNLNRAIRYLGRILVDAAPNYYDTKRVVRSLGEDGKPQMVELDPGLPKPSVKQGAKAIYNIGVGRYDVSVSSGPSYTTKRQESADAMFEMVRSDPSLMRTHGDLIVRSQDWPMAEEFAERSRLVMPPELQQAIAANDDEQGQNPEVAAVEQRAQKMLDQARQDFDQLHAQAQALAAENARLKEQAEIKEREVGVKEYEAKTERLQAVATIDPAIVTAIVEQTVQQTVAEIMRQPVPGGPPDEMPEMMPNQPPMGGFSMPGGS